jgi:hypothetical protein
MDCNTPFGSKEYKQRQQVLCTTPRMQARASFLEALLKGYMQYAAAHTLSCKHAKIAKIANITKHGKKTRVK